MAIIAITTSNSINVKPIRFCLLQLKNMVGVLKIKH